MTTEEIKHIIISTIPNAEVFVLDPMRDGQHLQAFVISSAFERLALVKQHQLVMRPLKDVLRESVHALALKTFTPQKWSEEKSRYGF